MNDNALSLIAKLTLNTSILWPPQIGKITKKLWRPGKQYDKFNWRWPGPIPAYQLKVNGEHVLQCFDVLRIPAIHDPKNE